MNKEKEESYSENFKYEITQKNDQNKNFEEDEEIQMTYEDDEFSWNDISEESEDEVEPQNKNDYTQNRNIRRSYKKFSYQKDKKYGNSNSYSNSNNSNSYESNFQKKRNYDYPSKNYSGNSNNSYNKNNTYNNNKYNSYNSFNDRKETSKFQKDNNDFYYKKTKQGGRDGYYKSNYSNTNYQKDNSKYEDQENNNNFGYKKENDKDYKYRNYEYDNKNSYNKTEKEGQIYDDSSSKFGYNKKYNSNYNSNQEKKNYKYSKDENFGYQKNPSSFTSNTYSKNENSTLSPSNSNVDKTTKYEIENSIPESIQNSNKFFVSKNSNFVNSSKEIIYNKTENFEKTSNLVNSDISNSNNFFKNKYNKNQKKNFGNKYNNSNFKENQNFSQTQKNTKEISDEFDNLKKPVFINSKLNQKDTESTEILEKPIGNKVQKESLTSDNQNRKLSINKNESLTISNTKERENLDESINSGTKDIHIQDLLKKNPDEINSEILNSKKTEMENCLRGISNMNINYKNQHQLNQTPNPNNYPSNMNLNPNFNYLNNVNNINNLQNIQINNMQNPSIQNPNLNFNTNSNFMNMPIPFVPMNYSNFPNMNMNFKNYMPFPQIQHFGQLQMYHIPQMQQGNFSNYQNVNNSDQINIPNSESTNTNYTPISEIQNKFDEISQNSDGTFADINSLNNTSKKLDIKAKDYVPKRKFNVNPGNKFDFPNVNINNFNTNNTNQLNQNSFQQYGSYMNYHSTENQIMPPQGYDQNPPSSEN